MTSRFKVDELDEDVISEALHGSGGAAHRAMSRLYDFYAPAVNYAVGWACRATGYFRAVDDLRQEVWHRLLERDAKLLRYYDPKRGRLGPFIRTLAYQQALAMIHAERRQPTGASQAFDPEALGDRDSSLFVAQMIQSNFFRQLMDRAKRELDPLDLVLLREIRLKGRKMAEVASELGESRHALYKRNERLKDKLTALANELLAESDPSTKGDAAVVSAILLAIAGALTSTNGLGL